MFPKKLFNKYSPFPADNSNSILRSDIIIEQLVKLVSFRSATALDPHLSFSEKPDVRKMKGNLELERKPFFDEELGPIQHLVSCLMMKSGIRGKQLTWLYLKTMFMDQFKCGLG